MSDTGQRPGDNTVGGEPSWSSIMDAEDNPESREQRGGGGKKTSWAKLLGNSLPSSLDKNVLEVVLQKDERGGFNVSDDDCARLMRKLGLDLRPGVHVEEVQNCPLGRGVIFITLKKEVLIEKYCRYDVIQVTESGIRAILTKPAGKREVVINMKGIHPNTRDEVVIDYLKKFGRLASNKVIHSVNSDGPLKGFRNGDRSFKVEFKPKENMGTYHVIDGQKVTVRYPGQQQTCARCHETSQHCLGKGIAKKCDAAGGPKIELTDHILKLWQRIGYSPGDTKLSDEINEDVSDPVRHQEGGVHTPVKVLSDPTLFSGVEIKTFPKDTDHGAIMEFLMKAGLNEDKKDDVKIRNNGSVSIQKLSSVECELLISNVHQNNQFGRKLFCNGIIGLTPSKPAAIPTIPVSAPPTTIPAIVSSPASTSSSIGPLLRLSPASTATTAITNVSYSGPLVLSPTCSPNQSLLDMGAASVISQLDHNLHLLPNDKLARRYSLSLRDIPPGSLADEILNTSIPQQTMKKKYFE